MTLTLTWRKTLAVIALAILIAVAYVLGTSRSSGTAYASGIRTTATSTSTDADHITVSAKGTATGTPDTLRTSFSVRVNSTSVSGAVGQANADMARVQKALRANGVAAKDMQTSNVSLYSYETRSKKGGPLVRHYEMSEGLTATLRSIDKASAAIEAALTAGGSAVGLDGVSFDLSDDSSLLTTARANAFASAKTKATQYAGLSSRSLGAVTSITETVDVPQPMNYYAGDLAAASPASSSIPIAKGSKDVTVTVTVVFGLG